MSLFPKSDWSFKFRVLLELFLSKLKTPNSIFLLLALTACGFQPVYSKSSTACANSPVLAGVTIYAADGESRNVITGSAAPTTVARQFTENLEDLLDPASGNKPKTYRLEVDISQTITALGIARDGTAARYNLTINSGYRLKRISDGKLIDSSSVSVVTSYSNPSNKYFSTYISEQDARKRGVAELAELYRMRLASLTKDSVPPAEKPVIQHYENCPKAD